MRKYICIILVLLAIVVTAYIEWRRYEYLHQDLYISELPKTYAWNHYKEDSKMHFEVDYPDYAEQQPAGEVSHDDIGWYSVQFGNEFHVSAGPALKDEKQIDDIITTLEGHPSMVFAEKIKVGGYDAAVFSNKFEIDGPIVPGRDDIYILAGRKQYHIIFFHDLPQNRERILNSFKILEQP